MVSTLSLKEDLSFSHEGPFFLSQRNTEEQNTQRPTETLSQPISQSVTATFSSNALWTLYAEGLLWARNVRKKALLTLWALWEKKLPSVKERTPQRFVCVTSHSEGAFYFSQKNTEEQNTQRPTETLSQPISQNLTATFSSNALWTLYAGGLLWARNVRKKALLTLWALWEKKLPSVKERTPQRVVCVLSHTSGCVLFLTERYRRTEHTNFHRDIKSTDFTEPYSHL